MTSSGSGTEQRKSTVFFYTLTVKGFQHWQIQNVIAVEYAVDEINSLYTEGGIICFLWLESTSFVLAIKVIAES